MASEDVKALQEKLDVIVTNELVNSPELFRPTDLDTLKDYVKSANREDYTSKAFWGLKEIVLGLEDPAALTERKLWVAEYREKYMPDIKLLFAYLQKKGLKHNVGVATSDGEIPGFANLVRQHVEQQEARIKILKTAPKYKDYEPVVIRSNSASRVINLNKFREKELADYRQRVAAKSGVVAIVLGEDPNRAHENCEGGRMYRLLIPAPHMVLAVVEKDLKSCKLTKTALKELKTYENRRQEELKKCKQR